MIHSEYAGFQIKLLSEFDRVAKRLKESVVSLTEEELLKTSHWDMGEDARLREDIRFRQTDWDRWILSGQIVLNDALYQYFLEFPKLEIPLESAINEIGPVSDHSFVFCSGDPRFILHDHNVRLAAAELSSQPLVEEALSELEKYNTHLPLTTLEAVAASEPSGEWGPEALENMVEQRGWMKVDLSGRKLNDRMFVAKIKGHSMDDGKSGLTDGSYAVFELWPVGTRQNKTVLVRGSFNDPETGSYAVKKYVADIRDEEGLHHAVSLVSLNPDKVRYPDIQLVPENDDDISIIAQLISPLDSSQFGRKPKVCQKTGRRGLKSENGVKKITDRLKKTLTVFFENSCRSFSGRQTITDDGWKSGFICLDFDSGGLHIETTPLTGLPSFAKKISISSGDETQTLLASNLKHHTWRVAVTPSLHPYIWSAPGHEDMLDEDLDVLNLEGLSSSEPLLFRVDAAGIGHLMRGKTLSSGQVYRLVLPPQLNDFDSDMGEKSLYDNGWVLWEFELPQHLAVDLKTRFEYLGLSIGKLSPRACFGLQIPECYKINPRGISYPCFSPDALPVLIVEGIQTILDGELTVFLVSDTKSVSLPLPSGSKWHVELEGLEPGNYLVETIHERTCFGKAQLHLSVETNLAVPVRSDCILRYGKEEIKINENEIIKNVDINQFINDDSDFHISTPPLWPVKQCWHGEKRTPMKTFYANSHGDIEKDSVVESLRLYRSSSVGDYCLDFKELGGLVIQHHLKTTDESLFKRFETIIHERSDMIKKMIGQFESVFPLWIEPIMKLMNCSIERLQVDELAVAPSGTTAVLLNSVKRKKNKINKLKIGILILTTYNNEKDFSVDGEIRKFADKLCDIHEFDGAVITDGFSWIKQRAESRLAGKLFNIDEIIEDKDNELFQLFLFEFSGL